MPYSRKIVGVFVGDRSQAALWQSLPTFVYRVPSATLISGKPKQNKYCPVNRIEQLVKKQETSYIERFNNPAVKSGRLVRANLVFLQKVEQSHGAVYLVHHYNTSLRS